MEDSDQARADAARYNRPAPIADVVDDLARQAQLAMREDPATFRAGYSFANAVMAVASTSGYDTPTQVAMISQRLHERLTLVERDQLVGFVWKLVDYVRADRLAAAEAARQALDDGHDVGWNTAGDEGDDRACGCPADYHLADCPIRTGW